MNCKKCGSLIDKEANFCPYCGEKVVMNEKSNTYQDPFSQYRSDNTHYDQYQYQQSFSNGNKIQYADDFKSKEPIIYKDNKALIGLVLSILSIPLTFMNAGLGIALVIIAFILIILGFRHTSRGLKITSLIVSIISLVIVVISCVFMFVSKIEISFNNGYHTTIGDYFKDAFFDGYHSDKIEGYWLTSDNELFYLGDDGIYYLYINSENLSSNYFTGSYDVSYGYELGDSTLFSDDDYYYYTVNTHNNMLNMEDDYADSIKNNLEGEFIIKIDKINFDNIILYFIEDDKELKLDRYLN